MASITTEFESAHAQNRVSEVEILHRDHDLFCSFTSWLVHEEGYTADQLLPVIEKPWKWDEEFNTEFLPWWICQISPEQFGGAEAYVAGFVATTGLPRQTASVHLLKHPEWYGRHPGQKTYHDGMEDGKHCLAMTDGVLRVLVVAQGSELCEAMAADREVETGIMVHAGTNDPVVYPVPADTPTEYTGTLSRYRRSWSHYTRHFPECCASVDFASTPAHGMAYYLEGDGGQPVLHRENWDSQ